MSTKTKKTRVRRPRQGQNAGISLDKYEEIYRTYLEDQNVGSVASKCGVDRRTVKRYLEHGDPARGLRSIRERFTEVVNRAQEIEDMDKARTLAENLKLVREYKKVLRAKITEQFSADGISLTNQASRDMPAELSGALERMVRLEMSLLGEPDLKVEMKSPFEGWTREEMIAYATKHKRPKDKGINRETGR